MMKTLYKEEGSSLRIDILQEPGVETFIDAHTSALNDSLKEVEMSEVMRDRLQKSNYVFSGMKTFHELNEAFPALLDEHGNKIPFERFLNDVQNIDETYNKNYLRAEYNFIGASAQMAAKWEAFAADGDRYNLQYRTVGDKKVRPEHAALNRVTLPMSDPFWDDYFPPNGWNCRCTVVQVRKSKYPETPHEKAMALGEEANGEKSENIFKFNPGRQRKTVPDYNPYTVKRCNDCSISKSLDLVAYIPDNELCAACKIIRGMAERYKEVPTQKGKVRIHSKHGKNESPENIKVATHLANKHGYEIDLLPKENRKSDADSYNRTLGYKQEYKVNSTPTTNAIEELIRKGKRQAGSIVLMVESDISLGNLRDAITNRVRRSANLKNLTIVIKGKDVTYTREQILQNSFKIKQEDFK